MSENVYIVGAVRTPIGKFGGALSTVPAADLGSLVIKEAINRAGIKSSDIDEVIFGCVLQSGLGQNIARQCAIKAGLPEETPALTINNVCGSGLKSINLACSIIKSGDADIVVAGGTENMSLAPYVVNNARFGLRMNNSTMVDTMINDALFDAFNEYHMGVTAENVAEKYNITREMQDEFATVSQNKCEKAMQEDRFKDEIVGVEINSRKGPVVVDKDEYPRSGVTKESLSKLKPAFKKDGTVTAANSSGINDGAACVIVMSEKKVNELGIKPLAKIVSGAWKGVDPKIMGVGPVGSTQAALEKANLSIDDIDLIEANEAFAAQSIAVCKALNIPDEKVNVNGGAIALGHPVGASGCRILVSLIHEMKKRNATRGLATLCVGGGMGVTTIVENV